MTKKAHDLFHSFADIKRLAEKIYKTTKAEWPGNHVRLMDIHNDIIMLLSHLNVVEKTLTMEE